MIVKQVKNEHPYVREIMGEMTTSHKRVTDSLTEQQYLLMPKDMNGHGRLFGGELMKWIDGLAGIVALRHSNRIITTACIDNLQFVKPAIVGQMVVLVGRVTYVGTTSMEIRVDTFTEELDGTRTKINRAYLVEVALDDDGNPCEVPGLILETEEDRQEWEAGERRRALRSSRRKEHY